MGARLVARAQRLQKRCICGPFAAASAGGCHVAAPGREQLPMRFVHMSPISPSNARSPNLLCRRKGCRTHRAVYLWPVKWPLVSRVDHDTHLADLEDAGVRRDDCRQGGRLTGTRARARHTHPTGRSLACLASQLVRLGSRAARSNSRGEHGRWWMSPLGNAPECPADARRLSACSCRPSGWSR